MLTKSTLNNHRLTKSYHQNGKNLYKTCQHFKLNLKTVLRWLKDEEKIKVSKRGSKGVRFDRRAQLPDVEEHLHVHKRIKVQRDKGQRVVVQDL